MKRPLFTPLMRPSSRTILALRHSRGLIKGIRRAEAGMTFQLIICDGPEKGRSFDLQSGHSVVLGRGEDCDICLADPRASRVHCRLEVGDDSVVLVDAGSTWGTKLNGNAVKQQRLKSGDVIELGETRLRL